MSEGETAAIVPFGHDNGEVDTHDDNPARRLHMAEAVRMAEAIVLTIVVRARISPRLF